MNLKYLAAIVASAFVMPAMAKTDMPRVDKREANQEKRIEQGVQSGQLTPKEAARLEKGQQKVEKMESKATADGKVTKKEKAKLHHAQNKQSRHIAKQKHDTQKVAPATGSGS